MKTIVITDFAGCGGTKTYFFTLVSYLLDRHHTVVAYLASKQAVDNQEYNQLTQAGVTIKYMPGCLIAKSKVVKRLRIDKIGQLIFLLTAVHGPLDQIIVSTGHSFNFLSGAWIWGKRFCLIQHTYPQGSPSFFTRFISPMRSWWFKRLAATGCQIATVSEFAKINIQHFIGLSDASFPIQVIYNSSPIGVVNHDVTLKKTVVTIGQLEKWKNPEFWLEVAIDVVEQNKEVDFIWIGTGSLVDKLSRMIPQQYRSRIQLVGYLKDVRSLLSRATIYFQPSRVENHSISVIEAMASALPCVVSHVGGLPESVQDGVNGYVVELNRHDMVEKIIYLLENPDIATAMGKLGQAKYVQKYTPDIWRQNMDRLLCNQVET